MFLLDPLEKFDPTLFTLKRVGSNPSGAGSKIKWTECQDKYIKQCYEQQKSVKLLSQLFSTSEETMRNHLHSLGVKTLSRYEIGTMNRHRNSFFFHNIDTPEKAYWLGFLYADGYVNEKDHAVRINLKASDEEHLKKFLFCLHALKYPIEYQVQVLNNKNYYIAYINIIDHQLVTDLMLKGCSQAKTFKLTYPGIDIVPENLQSHFIRGLMDADGSIAYTAKDNSALKYFSLSFLGTKKIVEGIKNYLRLENVQIRQIKNIYGLHINGNVQVYETLCKIYENSYYEIELTRKREKFEELKWQRENMFGYKKGN